MLKAMNFNKQKGIKMNLDELTIGQAKQLANLFNNSKNQDGINDFLVGEYVIIRTFSAGVWFGKLDKKVGNEVILKDARRMWYWKAKQTISLSGVAKYGIDDDESKIVEAIESVWLEAIEIIQCTKIAIESINGAKNVNIE